VTTLGRLTEREYSSNSALARPATMLVNSPTASTTSPFGSVISSISMAEAAFRATAFEMLSTTVPFALPDSPITPLTSCFGLLPSFRPTASRRTLQPTIVSKTLIRDVMKGLMYSTFTVVTLGMPMRQLPAGVGFVIAAGANPREKP